MMDVWTLPTEIEISGVSYKIRTDWHDIINILIAMNDPNLNKEDKLLTMLDILYIDMEIMEDTGNLFVRCKGKNLTSSEVEEAMKKATEFIDAGITDDGAPKPRTMDWEHDAPIIFPAVNKAVGKDVRTLQMHWWTFLGFFMEIQEGTFTQVVSIRQKKAKHEKLEKWEQQFYRNNKKLIDLPRNETEEEKEERERLNNMLN